MSAVPAAVSALIAAIDIALPDTQLLDGPPLEWLASEVIIVGFARDQTSVTVETTPAGFGSPDQEAINIVCLISCASGNAAFQVLRSQAFTLYDAVAAKIRTDKTLGGTVASARLAVTAVDQLQTQTGPSVDLTFTVSCLAFI